jgi:hypothetical protein
LKRDTLPCGRDTVDNRHQDNPMTHDYQPWNRDELYHEVWSTPMQKLAEKYGISDVGLAKVCRKLAIPVPGRGYWAKKEAGQELSQLPLPPLKEKIVLYKPQPRPESPNLADYATQPELAQGGDFHRDGRPAFLIIPRVGGGSCHRRRRRPAGCGGQAVVGR